MVERRVAADVAGHVRSVEGVLPGGQRIWLPKHDVADDVGLDVREVPKHPERVGAAPGRREHDAVVAHFLDASQNPVPALVQIIAYEIDGVHCRRITSSLLGWLD